MIRPFDIKKLAGDRNALLARIELALALAKPRLLRPSVNPPQLPPTEPPPQ